MRTREKDPKREASHAEEEDGGPRQKGPCPLSLGAAPEAAARRGHGERSRSTWCCRSRKEGCSWGGHLHFRTLHRGFCCAAPPLKTRRYCHGHQERVSPPAHTLCVVTTGLFLSTDSKHHEGRSHGNLLTVVSPYLQYSQACRRCFVQTVFVD